MTTEYTRVLRLRKPDFRNLPWSSDVNTNMDDIDDAIVNALSVANTELWLNGTLYKIGRIVIDNSVSPATYWICNVEHTSPIAPITFLSSRVSHPTYWTRIPFGITPRGEWANDTDYDYFDLAYDPTLGITGLCKTPHTSGSTPNTIQDDAANWDFIVDLPSMGTVEATAVSFDNTTAGLSGPPTDVQAALDALDALIDSIGGSLSSLTGTVGDLSDALDADEITIGNHTGTLTSVGTRLDTDEDDIDDLQTRMTQAEADITGIGVAFTTGTAMLFWQATAPTGWTKSTTHNDKALRVVSGTSGGGNGGSVAFSTVFSRYLVDTHTLSEAELAYHIHYYGDYYPTSTSDSKNFTFSGYSYSNFITDVSYADTGRYTGAIGSNSAHGHGCEMRVAYLDLIICTKN